MNGEQEAFLKYALDLARATINDLRGDELEKFTAELLRIGTLPREEQAAALRVAEKVAHAKRWRT